MIRCLIGFLLILIAVIPPQRCYTMICNDTGIVDMMCYQLYPALDSTSVYSTPVPKTKCKYTKENHVINIQGCDNVIPYNTSEYNFGESTQSITVLTIEMSDFVILESEALTSWQNIEILQFNMNPYLKRFKPGLFNNLSNVIQLTISNNPNLEPLEYDTFKGLTHLKRLVYLKNDLKNIISVTVALTTSILPSLTYLDLTGNNIIRIEKDEFKPMQDSPLQYLFIKLTKTEWIHREALDPLKSLQYLTLSKNNFNNTVLIPLINHLIKVQIPILYIMLDSNFLGLKPKSLFEAIAQNNSAITRVSLKGNHIGVMQPGFFPHMPNIEVIDLTNTMLDDIPVGVITEEFMPKLKGIFLGQNIFSKLKASMVTKTVIWLDMSMNKLPENSLFQLDPEVLDKMSNLQFLGLNGNRLYNLRKNILKKLISLQILFLKNTFLNKIEDCAFSTNTNLIYLDLSSNIFPMINNFSKTTFQGLDNLLALDLSDCLISYIQRDVFYHLKKLKYLSLRKNVISSLDQTTFVNMPHLYIIDLRNNILGSWSERIFRNNKKLNQIFLDYNNIKTITDTVLSDIIASKKVTLQGNSIQCNCEFVDVVQRAVPEKENWANLPFSNNINKCINLPGKTLYQYLNQTTCLNKKMQAVITFVLSFACITFTTLFVFVIYYYYKYDIHFWLLRKKRKLGLLHYIKSPKNVEKPEDFKYDAFVSYSIEDERFVEKMVYILEKDCSRFKLCVFERDFNVGDVLTDKILECIECSNRTIIVLTESFARSQWCSWEMYIAQNRNIFLNNGGHKDSLILIKKSQIPDSLMTPTLRNLMRTRVYLEWHDSQVRQNIFWEQLKNSLKPRRTVNSSGLSLQHNEIKRTEFSQKKCKEKNITS